MRSLSGTLRMVDEAKAPMITKIGVGAIALAIIIIVADQVIKFQFLGLNLLPGASIPFTGPVHLSMVWNTGVSFGLLRAESEIARWALSLFPFGVAAVLAWWARTADRGLIGLYLGLLIGGAIGNAIDRVRYGAVVDYLDVTRLGFPWVFNLADSAITVGIMLFLLDSFRREAKPS